MTVKHIGICTITTITRKSAREDFAVVPVKAETAVPILIEDSVKALKKDGK